MPSGLGVFVDNIAIVGSSPDVSAFLPGRANAEQLFVIGSAQGLTQTK